MITASEHSPHCCRSASCGFAGVWAGSGPVGYKWMLIVCALLVMAGLEGMAFAGTKALIQFFVFLIGFGGGV